MFHRHRVYNPREGVWMGWERKRGKLLDFNRLIKGEYDSFPVKIGDLSMLPRVRFVLTLDSRHRTAARNGASAGRRAGPSLESGDHRSRATTSSSRVSAFCSRASASASRARRSRGWPAFIPGRRGSIFIRAPSPTFIRTCMAKASSPARASTKSTRLHQVLEHRFPRNALLSHDLIEGAYARAGLVSDVEVIDDYPSHYSAYNRRKHRWLRGDWQIVELAVRRVPDESGRRVRNPISFLSRWKILDNLRRSLVEPAIFLLFVLGWTVLPGTSALLDAGHDRHPVCSAVVPVRIFGRYGRYRRPSCDPLLTPFARSAPARSASGSPSHFLPTKPCSQPMPYSAPFIAA